MTMITFSGHTMGSSGSDGHTDLVNSIAPEPLKASEPKLAQILNTPGSVFKVVGLTVMVNTDVFRRRHNTGRLFAVEDHRLKNE